MRYIKSCGFVAYKQIGNENYYLIIKGKNGDVGFPKGHVERGETEHQTALREVKEETSLSVVLEDGFREESTYRIGRNAEKLVVYFLAFSETLHVKIQYQEISAYVWVDVKEAGETISFDNDRRILQNAVAFVEAREAK
jgi:8-oxo-dGTP pyrophosphatase MutT (NUDIX family)